MSKSRLSLVAIVLATSMSLSTLSTVSVAENWPHWRGPQFNGSTTETGLPTQFGPGENVKWTAALPGESASTPIVFGDRVFVTSVQEKSHTLMALCFDRLTGKQLWSREVGDGSPYDSAQNPTATASPTTDGKLVVFFYGTGQMACFSVDGKPTWHRNICEDYGFFSFLWTFSSSPTLYGGRLYLPVMQRNEQVRGRGKAGAESYLLCIDPATGKDIWRHVRPSKARSESLEAFTTMIPYEYNGRSELLVAGGDAVSGHDPQTGKELWRWGTWNPVQGYRADYRLVPSPVAGDGVILACAPKGKPIYAVKAGLTGEHWMDDSVLAWVSNPRETPALSSDVATPAYYMGHFYVVNTGRRSLACIEPKTGKVVWQIEKLPGRSRYQASPTVGDGKIYCIDWDSNVAVVDARTGKILNQTQMDKDVHVNRPSIALSQGNLFIKANKTLYCIGK